MNTKDDRDRSVDRLLRQSFQASGGSAVPGSSCLDAETLGAWAEGRLSKSGLAAAEAHLSECSRCQRIVAVLAKIPASAPEARPWWQWGVDLRWLVPLAAGATAVALWVAVPRREAPQSAVGSRQSAVEAPPAAPPEGRVQAMAEDSVLKSDAADAQPQAERESNAPRAASPPAAVPTAEAATGARAEAFALSRQTSVIAQEVVSPTPLVRWRIGPRGLLQYSASGGAAWEQLSTDVAADLLAGASPSSTVCWVVGRAGTVLLTVDGRRFDRLPFPATVDLTAVRATDARTAVVATADGRMFSTSDGGSTWAQ